MLITGVFYVYPKISDHLPKISEDFPKLFRRPDERPRTFPKISENSRGCPKIADDCRRLSRKTRRCFDDIPTNLRTFARNFSNIDFFLKILPLKDHQLAISEV